MIKGRNILKRAIAFFGERSQHNMVIEETLELGKEIMKWKRGANNRDALVEETADVIIMIEQLKIMHNITDEELEKVMEFKLNRLDEGMKNGRYKSRVINR